MATNHDWIKYADEKGKGLDITINPKIETHKEVYAGTIYLHNMQKECFLLPLTATHTISFRTFYPINF